MGNNCDEDKSSTSFTADFESLRDDVDMLGEEVATSGSRLTERLIKSGLIYAGIAVNFVKLYNMKAPHQARCTNEYPCSTPCGTMRYGRVTYMSNRDYWTPDESVVYRCKEGDTEWTLYNL
eukprot:scaffold11990_cov60-Cylindrotheca_fusiformis.AAC.3